MCGTTSFSYSTLAGATSGAGTQGIIYNSATVQLISQATVGTATTTGQPRQALRDRFYITGYSDASRRRVRLEPERGAGGVHDVNGDRAVDRLRRSHGADGLPRRPAPAM
jgi:hypothetical protein